MEREAAWWVLDVGGIRARFPVATLKQNASDYTFVGIKTIKEGRGIWVSQKFCNILVHNQSSSRQVKYPLRLVVFW